MTIKDIELLTGLERATIRYYETEGLLTPQRRNNGYRDYTNNDVEILLRIKLLGGLHISLDEIKALFRGETQLHEIVSTQLTKLQSDGQIISQAQSICRAIQQENITLNTLDAKKYLKELPAENQTVMYQANQYFDQAPIVRHPWRRFFARMFDIFLYRTLWEAFLVLVFRYNTAGGTPFENLLASFIGIGWILVLEPKLLQLFRTTPGKAIFGLYIEHEDGRNLTYHEALSRTWQVVGIGFGYNIPFYSLWRLWKSYQISSSGLHQPWDETSNYSIKDTKRKRTIIMIASLVAVQLLSTTVFSTMYLAPHRGPSLTIAQFAENYDYYSKFFGAQFSDKYLDEHAQWKDKPFDGTISIGFGYTAMPEFHFQLENNAIKEVSFVVEINNSSEWLGSYQTHMFLTSMALLGSQKKMGLHSSIPSTLLRLIDSHLFEDFIFSEASVSIASTTTYSGYSITDSAILIPEQNADTYYKLTYTATIDAYE